VHLEIRGENLKFFGENQFSCKFKPIGMLRCVTGFEAQGHALLETKGDTMLITELLIQKTQAFGIMAYFGPIIIGFVYITLMSLIPEPNRKKFNAIMVAGAGAAYLNGGFGPLEFAFTTVMTYLAFRGLEDYRFIGVAWLAHTGWDFAHFLYGNPIVPFVATSSFGCAICDPVIALWCFAGGPSMFEVLRRRVGSGKLA
jgi:Family of unknown function (DUF6010)